jgi:hypothetical protein
MQMKKYVHYFHKMSTLKHPKFYAGTKYINIFDPEFFISLLEAKVYIPVIAPLKVNKDGVLMYLLQVKDVNRDLTLEVLFSLPEDISASVKLGSPEEEGGDLQAVWETNDSASDSFKAAVNRLLEYWLKQIQHANSFLTEPSINLLPRSCNLKWPWKNSTNEDYFKKFRSDLQIHKLRLGVGFYSTERNSVGVTLQLSNYPGQSLHFIQENSKRRGKRARAEAPDLTEQVDAMITGEEEALST